jgi:macrolide-specific efflux system membrane fusion protein
MTRSGSIIAIVVGILITLAGVLYVRPGVARGTRTVATVPVIRGTIRLTLTATGTVTPHSRVAMRPPFPGRIESMTVNEGDTVAQGQIVGTMSSVERVALLDAAALRGIEERLKSEDLIRPAPLVAPISGTVLTLHTAPGRTVSMETELLTVSDRLIIQATLLEEDVVKVTNGQCAEIAFDSLPGLLSTGRVERIASDARVAVNIRSYETDLHVDALPAAARSGMGASIVFTVASRENVLMLPASAIQEDDSGATVRLADSPGTAPRRTVRTGINDGQMVEILDGLAEGQVVNREYDEGIRMENKGKSPLLSPYNGK